LGLLFHLVAVAAHAIVSPNNTSLCVVWACTFSSYPRPHVPAVHLFPPRFDPPVTPTSCHPRLIHAAPVIGPVSRPIVSPSISTPHPPCKQLLAAVVVGAGSWWCPGGHALPVAFIPVVRSFPPWFVPPVAPTSHRSLSVSMSSYTCRQYPPSTPRAVARSGGGGC